MKTKKNILRVSFMVLIAFQAFFIYKRVQNYPFMIYDMYSRPEAKNKIANQYLIVASKDTIILSKLPIHLEGRIRNSLNHYEYHHIHGEDPWTPALESRAERMKNEKIRNRMRSTLSNDRLDVDRYPVWLKEFLERKVIGRPISSLKVFHNYIDLSTGAVIYSNPLIEL